MRGIRGPRIPHRSRNSGALHDRVARIGTVHQFIQWFDHPYTDEAQTMESSILSISPHSNTKTACSAHGTAAACTPLIADVVLRDAGSDHVEWAVCARWLRENSDATAWLNKHPDAAARLGPV